MFNKYYIKNLFGKHTKRQLVAFSVDDYGTQRTASLAARINLLKIRNHPFKSRFDMYDSLETSEDLEMLFETLHSVKDKNGNNAVFTAFSLSANPNFEEMIRNGYTKYIYESLPETYQKMYGNLKVMSLIQEGIRKRIFVPQYHGREHINIKVMMYLLSIKDPYTIACFENNSYSGIYNPFKNISFTGSFGFEDFSENHELGEIAKDGLRLFELVYGYKAEHFTAPGMREHNIISSSLFEGGIKYIDRSLLEKPHLGNGRYGRISFYYTGEKNRFGQRYIVRNCVFEPTNNRSFDSVAHAMKLIDAAFTMHTVANISSHRVNFCGSIDPENRAYGLMELSRLLKAIIRKYPEVEFITTSQILNDD